MNSQPGTLLGIHHVALISSDYDISKRFYVEVLGCRIIAENYRAERKSKKLDVALPDGTQIEIFSFPDPPPRQSRPEACGLRHLAFRVSNVEKWSAHLAQKGISTENIRVDEYTGRKFFFISDPDGIPLEFYEG